MTHGATTQGKHTPGTWTLSPFGRGVDVIVGERIIAECKAQNGSELASCEANARLIAAAPELLAACTQVLADVGAGKATILPLMYGDLAAAIAEAERSAE